MSGAHEALEHSEHISHAGGGHGDHPTNKLGTYIGITMAVLGVLLAFCAAKVGGERTELVQTLVEQQNSHAKYQGQDIKHRVAFLQLQAVHSVGPAALATQDKKDLVAMAKTVDRYLEESALAKEWVEAYDPAIEGHVQAQEHYELAQLAAEIGIVVASVALLMKRKAAWFVALFLGAIAVGMVGYTYSTTHSVIKTAEEDIHAKGKIYRDTRNKDKTTTAENALVEEILHSAGGAPAEHGGAVPEPATHGTEADTKHPAGVGSFEPHHP